MEEKFKLIDEIAELRVNHVNLTGGEPTIHPHFEKAVERLYCYGVSASVVTNATRVSDDFIKFISRYGVYVIASLDGPRGVHEKVRGPGTYDLTVENLRLLKKSGIPFTIVTAVNEVNYGYVGTVIDLAPELGADDVALIPTMPSGRAVDNKVYVSKESYLKALKIAEEKAEERGIWLSLWCTPFAPLVVSLKYVTSSFCRSASVIDIDPSGNLLLCDVLNVKVSSVKKGLRRALSEYYASELFNGVASPKELPPECKECKIKEECKGGCFARSYLIYGGLNAGDPLCPRITRPWTASA